MDSARHCCLHCIREQTNALTVHAKRHARTSLQTGNVIAKLFVSMLHKCHLLYTHLNMQQFQKTMSTKAGVGGGGTRNMET